MDVSKDDNLTTFDEPASAPRAGGLGALGKLDDTGWPTVSQRGASNNAPRIFCT